MPDICAICLCMNIELQSLDEPLSNFHDELCDFGIYGQKLYCTKCVYLLKKFYNFKNKCLKSNLILKKWKKLSKTNKFPLKELHTKLPNSLGFSNESNHIIYSYNAKIENADEYIETHIDKLIRTTIEDEGTVVFANVKPGYVILDSTAPQYTIDAPIVKSTDINIVRNENTIVDCNKLYIDDGVISDIETTETDGRRSKKVRRNNTTAKVDKTSEYFSDANSINRIQCDIFSHKAKNENDIKDGKVNKNQLGDEIETLVIKVEDFDEDDVNLNELAIAAKELKVEGRNSDDDSNYDDNDQDIGNDDIDNDEINSAVLRNYGGKDDDFDIEKLLKEALNSDSSDDEVLQRKRRTVVKKQKITKQMSVTKKRSRKRKSEDDDEELDENEPEAKKSRWKPVTKKNLEDTIKDVQRRLGNGDVKDKDGNILDVDVILNHLEKMHKYSYNKIKRYCSGHAPLTTEAIDFLGRIQKRYGNQYSSIFITKHLTNDEEIIREFRKRETNQNYVQCEHKCTRCFRYFRFAKMLDYHIAEYHDPNKPHKCQYCDVSFSRPQGLRKHLLAHRTVYKCKLCPLVTNYTTVMETHFNIHKGVRYPCNKCDADFKSPPALAAHMNYVHQSDHICQCCARNFHSEFGLHQHKMKKHPNDQNPQGPPSAKCEECNIQFISDEVYLDHRRKSHSDPKNVIAGVDMSKKRKPCTNRRTPRYTCRVCATVESSMGALIWHFKKCHPDENVDRKGMALREPYQYLCHECGKGFKLITAFTDHKNVHTGARPFACSECPKAFHSRTHLRNHMAFHQPPTKQCAQCGKKFHSKSNLSNHLRQHTGNRRYACEVCGKTFLHQGSVNAHVRGVHLHIRRSRKPGKLLDTRACHEGGE